MARSGELWAAAELGSTPFHHPAGRRPRCKQSRGAWGPPLPNAITTQPSALETFALHRCLCLTKAQWEPEARDCEAMSTLQFEGDGDRPQRQKAFFVLDAESFPKGGMKEGQDFPHIGIPIFAQSLLEQAKGSWQEVTLPYGVAIHSPGML